MRASQSLSRLVIALGLMTASFAPMHKANAENATPYPAETITAFTNTCTNEGSGKGIPAEVMQQICACSIEALQEQYTFEQFAKIDADLGAGKPAPAEMDAIVQSCVKQSVSK
jgi:hypothetical protein